MTIKPRKPFDFARTLRFVLGPPAPARLDGGRAGQPGRLRDRGLSPLLDYFVEGEFRRAAEVAGQTVLFGVRQEGERGARRLCARVLVGPKDRATLRALGVLVERMFSTRLDLLPFYRLACSDRVMARLTRHFRGMRIPQTARVFESVVSAILEQQVNLTFAHQVKKALIETYGRPVEFAGRSYNTFPSPAALAIATPQELRRVQISGPKARAIIAIARAQLDGSLDLEGLCELEPALAYSRLIEQRGVGPWTAQYVGLRALGHADCLPSSDVGLQKTIQVFYRLRHLPSVRQVEQWGRGWPGWRSYATFYLWMTAWAEPEERQRLLAETAAV